MTQTLHVPTPFQDLSELANDFSQRVDEERIVLPNSAPMNEGEWVTFTVTLADGSVGLEGTGRVKTTYENGEEYPPEYRYDIELDMLQFDGRSEVMYERILMARQSAMEGDPGTGEVDVAALQQQGAPASSDDFSDHTHMGDENSLPGFGAASPSTPAPPATEDEFGEQESAGLTAYGDAPEVGSQEGTAEEDAWAQSTQGAPEPSVYDMPEAVEEVSAPEFVPEPPVASPRSVPPAAPAAARSVPPAAPAPRSVPPAAPRPAPRAAAARTGGIPAMHVFDEGILLRATLPASFTPGAVPRPSAAQSSGLFDYQGNLPRPAEPPRPAMDENLRVAPAPTRDNPWMVSTGEPPASDATGAFEAPPDDGIDEGGDEAQWG